MSFNDHRFLDSRLVSKGIVEMCKHEIFDRRESINREQESLLQIFFVYRIKCFIETVIPDEIKLYYSASNKLLNKAKQSK